MKFFRKVTFLIAIFMLLIIPGQMAMGQGTGGEIGFFEEVEIRPGIDFEVPVEVRGTNDLFAVDIEIRFDPQVLQARDADPDSEGIQLGLGEFLDPGLLLYNEIDNEEGLIRFAMSQVNPSEGKSGDGVLLVIYFESLDGGESTLEITKLETSDRMGDAVLVEAADGVVVVESSAPERQATAIPVVNPTAVIIVPTSLPPTAVPTAMPTATTIVPTATQAAPTATQAAPTSTQAATVMEETEQEETEIVEVVVEEAPTEMEKTAPDTEEQVEGEKFNLFNSWWFAGLMFVVLIVLAVLFFSKQKKPTEESLDPSSPDKDV